MASTGSSASVPAHSFKHDVFLSFRGEDTRHSFISHLHSALRRKSIRTFIDNELRSGEEISQSLLNAIEESMLAVVVFSEGYAFSRWCLDELAKIVECIDTRGQKVIPVFYHVDPSDVRKQTGTFAEAFVGHEATFNSNIEKLQRWRAALTKAGNLSGWPTKDCRSESAIVDEIVNRIWKDLQEMWPSPSLEGLVGVGPRIEKLQALLSFSGSSRNVFILGLWGMGGIGKTAIAKALFGQIKFRFERCCFLANVREESEKRGLENLRERLLSVLLEEEIKRIGLPDIGQFFSMLRRMKILLVLDDVNDRRQLEYLTGDRGWYSPGSRIIITSRDKQLLKNLADDVYEVEPLLHPDALQLFSLHAFKDNGPTDDLRELSRLVVCYAKGVPLALKGLGYSLFDKSKREWESTLKKLENAPNKEIQQVLRISYSSLDEKQKELFLWIACCLKGWEKGRLIQLLDGCGFSTESELSVLVDKSLITIGPGRIEMHDLLQEMGREIVREKSKDPGERSWLWNHEDIYQVFKRNSGTKNIEGIYLESSKMKEVQLDPDTFGRMPNLKFLEIHSINSKYKVRLPKGISALPDELRYLYWDGYPLESLPANFNAENLIELRLTNSNINKLFCDEMQDMVKLRLIYLYGCSQLHKISNLSWARNVTELCLQNCHSLCEVSSICHLSNATSIDLSNCPKLTSLPDLSDLKSLTRLYLNGSSKLKTFPKVSRSIKYLHIAYTAIKEVPSTSLKYLDNLVELFMYHCHQLESLPSDVDLKSLEILDLAYCTALKHFPEISNNLKKLFLDKTAITIVPSSVRRFRKLFLLSLNGCAKLRILPRTSRNLEELQLNYCKSLQSLPDLPPNLLRIKASGCTSLKTVSATLTRLVFESKVSRNRLFNFADCSKLREQECGDMVRDLTNFITNEHRYKEFGATPSVSIIYMGSTIPKCFEHHSDGDSIGFQLSSNLLNRGFLGFALGIVYKPCDSGLRSHRFNYVCHIGDNEFSGSLWLSSASSITRSNHGTDTEHILVKFDHELRDEIFRIARKSQSYDEVVVLKFESRRDWFSVQRCCEVKMCGVIPLYAQGEGYSTFRRLPLQALPKQLLKRRLWDLIQLYHSGVGFYA